MVPQAGMVGCHARRGLARILAGPGGIERRLGGAGPRDGGRQRRAGTRAVSEDRLERAPARWRAVRLLASLGLALVSIGGSAPEPTVSVVCLGDSLTEGLGVDRDETWPRVVERRLRELGRDDVRMINAGIGGATTLSAGWRFDWQLRARPDVLILALGANDRLILLPLEETRRNLSAVIETAKRSGVRVILAGMKLPPTWGLAYGREFAALFPELAREHGVTLLPFLLEGVAARPELNQRDGVHPNAEGYERVAENVLEVLLPLL